MFGLSRRRMKLGRVKKLQLSDSAPGGRSPSRPPKHVNTANNESASASSRLNEIDCESPPTAPEIDECAPGCSDNWMILSIPGDNPKPRFNHAATVIENKMIVVGGESANGLLDDVQVLDFDKFTWTTASSKLYLSPSSLPMKIPACKGHSLVSWGKKVLLIGGKTEPARDRVSVWAFDIETECWSLMEAKGDIPVARSGHTVVRANSSLILFGGEDSRRRKMNDLYVFDLKSLTWLPLHCTGTGPSARCNHVATFYDRTLYIFGGASKSRTLNDLYSLDFDAMIWSRIKIQDFHPSPRSGCCGVLCGTRWYISGGGSRKKRYAETLIYDILKGEWSVANAAPPLSITSNKGFSLNLVQHQEKNFLVAFGGCKKEPSSQVEVLIVDNNESLLSHEPISRKVTGPLFGKRSSSAGSASQLSGGSSQRLVDSVARQSLASAVEQHGSGRKSLSESTLVDANPVSGNISLRKQFSNEEEYNRTVKTTKCMEDDSLLLLQAAENRMSQRDAGNQTNIVGAKNSMEETSLSFDSDYLSPHNNGMGTSLADNDDMSLPETNCKGFAPASSSIYQVNGTKMASLIRKNGILEGQLASALANQEAMEKNLSFVLKSKQDMEKKLADTMKEMDLLKEKLAGLELAQEEATNLSNNVHSDNVRLEHDVAFLKAVLDDTQKELHSTRGVLAGERARTFQLQVEVFHLKQRLQSMENRAPTPRKPFHA